ncbi:MAG: GMC family oxidoreductase N-terminal domain-containing protein, partial [Pseudomonadota bacterium]
MTTEIYDYIIVGAGSAGCVLAERLTACGRHTVLLLEAGGSDRRFWVRTPLGYAKTFQDPAVNWRYRAAADPGLNGREAYWPRGRVLGGSSSINAMAYLRGLPQDFDGWEAAGATGWNWAAVRRTYAAIEAPEAGDAPICSVRLSELGPRRHPFTRHFLEGARQMGWPVADARAAAQDAGPEGLAALRSTLRRGRRWSAADAFLRPALRRRNLRVITHAQAERVVMSQGRAEGVVHRHQGRTRFAAAAREVILSGGAVNSPQLLHLSGIGAAEALRRLGIAVALDLPQVGRGLQDHLAISHAFQANEATLNNALGSWVGKGLAGARYLLSRGGPLALPINQISG